MMMMMMGGKTNQEKKKKKKKLGTSSIYKIDTSRFQRIKEKQGKKKQDHKTNTYLSNGERCFHLK